MEGGFGGRWFTRSERVDAILARLCISDSCVAREVLGRDSPGPQNEPSLEAARRVF